jgi:hypothetical protein
MEQLKVLEKGWRRDLRRGEPMVLRTVLKKGVQMDSKIGLKLEQMKGQMFLLLVHQCQMLEGRSGWHLDDLFPIDS